MSREMAVLNSRFSMSWVTALMVRCSILTMASSPPDSAILAVGVPFSAINRDQARRRNRCTPWMPSSVQGFSRSRGAHEHLVQPHGIGAVFRDDVVGIDDVVA